MDVESVYASRALSREPLSEAILQIISKLKISFKPPFRRPHFHKKRDPEDANWRQNALADVVRKVRETADADYDAVSSCINKMSKQNFIKMIVDILARLDKRDAMFRLRVTTLLFDRGVRQPFFAPMMTDAYAEVAKAHPEALQDLQTLVHLFDDLYDASKVIVVPASTEPGYDEAIFAWTKQKEMKRGFAVYVSELYTRALIPPDTMLGFIRAVLVDLHDGVRAPKTSANEENVDGLVRFLFAVAPKIDIRDDIRALLAIPREQTISLSMKSRFKLEDTLKLPTVAR
jgi:hypothetical protein